MAQIASGVKRALGTDAVPMVCFAKGAHWAFKWLESTDYDALSMDWTMEYARVGQDTGGRVAVQGNLDPCALYGGEQAIREYVARMMAEMPTVGHVANLGHGM